MSERERPSELSAALGAMPVLVQRLLVEHLPTPDGRCRTCAIGAQSGRQHWPCSIYSYAAAAGRSGRPTAADQPAAPASSR